MVQNTKIRRIYFDSSALIEAGWPHVSPKLEQLLSLAQRLKVKLFLPLAVEQETEAHWLRDLQTKVDEMKSAADALRRVSKLDAAQNKSDLTSLEEKTTAYRTKVAKAKKHWKFDTVDFTSRPVYELFKLAISQVRPFREKGRGFQDAVIFASILDHLAEEPEPAVLIVNDNDFYESRIELVVENLKSLSLSLRLLKTDAASDELKDRLEERMKTAWAAQNEAIGKDLEERRQEIESFIGDNLKLEEIAYGNVVELMRISLQGIANVRSPDPRDIKAGAVEISADVELKVSAVVERSSFTGNNSGAGNRIGYVKSTVERVFETLDVTVELLAKANHADGKFDRYEMLSVRVPRSSYPFVTSVNWNPENFVYNVPQDASGKFITAFPADWWKKGT